MLETALGEEGVLREVSSFQGCPSEGFHYYIFCI